MKYFLLIIKELIVKKTMTVLKKTTRRMFYWVIQIERFSQEQSLWHIYSYLITIR